MKVKEARGIVAQAVAMALIDRNEGARRHNAITRNARNPRIVQTVVNDLADLVEQRARFGAVMSVGGEV